LPGDGLTDRPVHGGERCLGAVDANDDRPSWMDSVHQVSLHVLLLTSMFNAWRPISQGRLARHVWA
jgi:hypothetical protein